MNREDQPIAAAASASPVIDPRPTRLAAARRHLISIGIGLLAAEAAVLGRYSLDLPPDVLPFFTVVIAVSIVTVFAGFVGGLTTMVAGGLLSSYYLLNPSGSWSIEGRYGYPLLGYFLVTTVILATSQLYRLSEQKRHDAVLAHVRHDADRQRLFAREMAHRLKNALAIVQAMANQTFVRDTPELAKFDGRLKALADAHNLLNEHVKQPTASIDEVVETAIQPFRDHGRRFRLSGPAVPLPDQQVVSLTLALHELGTNAVKYGALSKPDGWVSVDWDEATDGKLRLEWKEHDGPAVKTPTTKGFGSRLLGRAAMGATVRYEKDGLRCVITSGRA
ncbi:MAG: sensor histidine kinase [Sphingomicrobium sp.]